MMKKDSSHCFQRAGESAGMARLLWIEVAHRKVGGTLCKLYNVICIVCNEAGPVAANRLIELNATKADKPKIDGPQNSVFT